jgi:hypothetical protein
VVRNELGCLLACVSITRSLRTAPMAALKVLLGLPLPLYLVAEAKASAYRLRGRGLWSGRDSDLGHARILVFRMTGIYHQNGWSPHG